MIEKVTEKFFRYVKIDTQSSEDSEHTPSTSGQMELARLLKLEMTDAGFDKSLLTENAYLYGFIAGTDKKKKSIGFIAHLDTSPAVSGKNVKPLRFRYNGGNITSNNKIILHEDKYLAAYIGEEIITSDGSTLLGADNKAGISEIMTACEYLIKNRHSLRFPDIYVLFVPDEEIGHQLKLLDLSEFSPDKAFTVDGGKEGEIEYGCFNASGCTITVKGKNCHPGYADGKLLSSIEIISSILKLLFEMNISPNDSKNDQGFIHVTDVKSNEESGCIKMILRDFTNDGISEKTAIIKSIIEECRISTSKKFNNSDFSIKAEFKEQYKNMEYEIKKQPDLMNNLEKAVIKSGALPILKRIRGGTDGAALSARGIPCPNIFTGGYNFHSTGEWIPVSSMEKAVKTLIELASGN